MDTPAIEPSARNTTQTALARGGPGGGVATVPHVRIGILGAGFGGIGMAIKLLEHGERDFVIFERAAEVGGTWRDNTYPGCQCDVASNVYSYSFAPNPNWTRSFAWQNEILDYIKDVTQRYGVRPHIRFEHEILRAQYEPDAQRWFIHTSGGDYTADVLISGQGAMSEPAIPDLPGLDGFQGAVFHSAEWNHDVDLKGKRVAVIGTGASAIQVVPSIQPEVSELRVFQRTPAWVVPRNDRAWSESKRAWYRRLPLLQKLARLRIYMLRELTVLGMRNPDLMQRGEVMAKRHLHDQVRDRELRDKLTPNYRMGCKRILLSDDYYPALTQPNVELVTDRIETVTPKGIVTGDGSLHEVDVIILCTGFKVQNHPATHRLYGRAGQNLAEHWAESGTAAFVGTTVPNFPNLFLLTGPNTGLGHNSMLYMLESQFTYILGALDAMDAREAGSVEVRREALEAYDRQMRAQLEGTVWTSGCASWYLDDTGRAAVWPTFSWRFRARTRRFDPDNYRFEPQRARQSRRTSEAQRLRGH